jgi:hypothetical protein
MRQLRHADVHGVTVAEVLDEFNARRPAEGIRESDLVSVSVLPPEPEFVLHLRPGQRSANVRVVIVYWGPATPAEGPDPGAR